MRSLSTRLRTRLLLMALIIIVPTLAIIPVFVEADELLPRHLLLLAMVTLVAVGWR